MTAPNPLDYDFLLPESAIAQWPAARRDEAKLLVIDRRVGRLQDRRFSELPEILPEGAVVVVNDTRVIPARLLGTRPTGGRVEVFLIGADAQVANRWQAWIRPSARVRPGMALALGEGLIATPVARQDEIWSVDLSGPEPVELLLDRVGAMPLPPYIGRESTALDRDRYQTIFASARGAVAAPTAGLHFSPEVVAALEARGVSLERVTLHVGPGTFAPLRADQLASGRLHPERYHVEPAVWERIQGARRAGRPIVAVGTTVTRTLESIPQPGGTSSLSGETTLFITPGHFFKVVDHLITNFHLPRSSLLMLVAALAGRERILDAYRHAVGAGYRFYSYGDASFIL